MANAAAAQGDMMVNIVNGFIIMTHFMARMMGDRRKCASLVDLRKLGQIPFRHSSSIRGLNDLR